MSGRRAWAASVFLIAIHLIAALAGFFAPYGHASQNREHPYAPPTPLRFIDADGGFHFVPFVYGLRPSDDAHRYSEDRSERYPVRLLARGEPYRLLGLFPASRHLISVEPPGMLLLMGTDGLGRDVFSRLVHGARASLFAGLLGAGLALSLGTLIGAIAGFYGGGLDRLLMRSSEIFMALPALYLLIAARAVQPLDLAPARAFLTIVLVLGGFGWPRVARLIRGVALSAREREYVYAARGFGARDLYLLRRHILPQIASVARTQGAVMVPQFILAEVGLSYLGVGLNPPVPSWGNMLAELQRFHVLASDWWWMASPGVALVLVGLAYLALSRDATVQHS